MYNQWGYYGYSDYGEYETAIKLNNTAIYDVYREFLKFTSNHAYKSALGRLELVGARRNYK